LLVPTDAAGAPVDLLPLTAEEAGGMFHLEVSAVLWDHARDRTLVFYTKAQRDPQRDSERRVGASIALWSRADAPAVRPLLRPGSDEPTLLFGASEPPWGSAVIAIGDWLYVYGCEVQGPRDLNIRCRLARVPPDRALDRAEWRFYTGSSWSADWRAAKPVLDGACRQMSVTWNDYLGKYVAVNTRILSSELSIRTADRPEGPWSEAIIVEGLAPPTGFAWITPGFVHPELERDGGRVQVITYARSIGIAGLEMRAVEIEFRKRQRE